MATQTPDPNQHILSDDSMVTIVLAGLESDGVAFDILDSKAGLLLGFGLVTIAELVGFFLLAVFEHQAAQPKLGALLEVLLYLGALMLLFGGASAMYALYPRGFTRNVGVRLPTEGKLTPSLGHLLESVRKVHEGNQVVLSLKGRWTRVAGLFVVGGIFCLALVAILLFRLLAR